MSILRLLDNELRDQIGKVIKSNRKAIGLSQEELGKKVGLTREYVSYLERGRRVPSVEAIDKIAAVYGKTRTDLFEEAELSGRDEFLDLALRLKKFADEADEEDLLKLRDHIESLMNK